MHLSFAQAVRLFFQPQTLVPFLLGSVVLGVLGNAVFALLTKLVGGTGPLVLIVGGRLVVLLVAAAVLGWALRRIAEAGILPGKSTPARHKGLIFLVSRAETTRHAVNYHLPALRHCWLFCSDRTRPLAEEVGHDYPQVAFHLVAVRDVNDPLEFMRLANDVYRRLPAGLTTGDVIADYVGMTAHGSVGLALACVGRDWPLQYIPGEYDADLKAVRPLDPIQIDLPLTVTVRRSAAPSPESNP
jgi:hypothetical protein